jgi:O-antigen ligase/polysaccharide polymerase Wzy-like membrane protein
VALAVALLLLRYDPPLYLGFAWWITFLSALVRRIVDYRIGYDATNPILIAPLLVIGASAIVAWRHIPKVRHIALLPFALMLGTVLYGFVVGLVRLGPWASLYGLLAWSAPICFGFYLATQWQQYPRYRQVLERTFVVSTLILGAYGVWQFVSPPPWDVYWIVTAGQKHQLSPKPFAVRVFGTFPSFGPFGLFMMVSVLISLTTRGALAKSVVPVGLLALLLSSVRGAWIGLLVALVVCLAYFQGRGRGRLLFVVAAIVAVLLLITTEPFRAVIGPRLRTLVLLDRDESYQERRVLFEHHSEHIGGNPIGAGVGATGQSASLVEGVRAPVIEHGFLDIFYSLGWLGGVVYCLGIVMLFARMLRRGEADDDNFAKAARGAAVAILVISLIGKIFVGVGGALLWGLVGLQLAARSFHAANRLDSRPR